MSEPTPREALNQYGVPNWLIEALKSYDGLMSTEKGLIKGNKMKAKRDLARAVNAEVLAVLDELEPLTHEGRGTIAWEMDAIATEITQLKQRYGGKEQGE